MLRAAGTPVRLLTARFEIRTRGEADPTDAFRRWAADPAMMGPMNLPVRTVSDEQVKQYWAGFDGRTRFFLGIADRETGADVGFWTVDANGTHRTASVHHAVDPAFWRQDVAVETGFALIDWLFDVQEMEKLTAFVIAGNAKAAHFLKLGGFREEGLLREELRCLTGPGRLDQLRLGLLRAAWKEARPAMLAVLEARGHPRPAG